MFTCSNCKKRFPTVESKTQRCRECFNKYKKEQKEIEEKEEEKNAEEIKKEQKTEPRMSDEYPTPVQEKQEKKGSDPFG